MENSWDEFYNKENMQIHYDGWLDKYKYLLKDKKILDLGCGIGHNFKLLNETSLELINLDGSKVALNQLKETFKEFNPKTIQFDYTKKLPFKNNSFDIIVADLSLHYFSKEQTKIIFNNLSKLLTKNGYLLIRVNANKDYNIETFEEDLKKYNLRRNFNINALNYDFEDFILLTLEHKHIVWRNYIDKYLFECSYIKR